MKKKIFMFILGCCFLLSGCSNAPKEVDYYIAEKDTTTDALVKEIGSKPSRIENQDDAEMYIYEDCKYYDYTGEMTYYFAQDMLTLSRWESIADSEKAGIDMYKTILKNMNQEYGEGTLSEDGYSCTWDTKKKKISLGYAHDEDGYKVYILENE